VVQPDRRPNRSGEAMVHSPLISSPKPTALHAMMPISGAFISEWRMSPNENEMSDDWRESALLLVEGGLS
jgi:hypothetical protein